MQYVSVSIPETRLQEVYELLARRQPSETRAPQAENAAKPQAEDLTDDLAVVKLVTQEAEPSIRSMLSHLAHRPDDAIAFADLCRELDIPHSTLRAAVRQFSTRWVGKYRQDPKRWFFDVITLPSGRVEYRMNARIAAAVLQALGEQGASK